jgi:RNA polymerase sigma-70 factor, ECF subfamily
MSSRSVNSDLRISIAKLHPEGFAWAMQCCSRDRAVAEEVLQEVYLKILDGRARFDGRSTLKTWLLALIRFTAADECRRLSRHQARLDALAAEPQQDRAAAPDETLAHLETRAEVSAALDALPIRQREVLVLVFYHDLSLDEAAAVMGVSPGTARTHYDRGKQKLRTVLDPALALP